VNRTFFVSNFGCRAAQSEGASIQEELLDGDASVAPSAYEADVVIVNSCTVTGEADRQVRQMIRRVASRNPAARVLVTGCYAQRAPEELAELPNVRYVVGNSHKTEVGRLAVGLFDEDLSSYGRAEILCSSIFLERELKPASHLGSGGRTRAVVKVQDGCNANCSFCIIPAVRGRSRSMNPESVLGEIRDLVSRNYQEVVFSGIHLGTYGRDLTPKHSLYDLICRALDVPGLCRFRLSSIEPLEVVPEIVRLVAEHPRMAHHFHIPLQSGSAKVLRDMRRPYTPPYYRDLVGDIRTRIADAAIGADVMVGFPGESDEDFSATYRVIESAPLTYLHVFPYSARPGTAAAELADSVPDHVARFRARTLRALIAQKNEEFRRKMVGMTLDVLTLEDGSAISSSFVRVRVPASIEVNKWLPVRIDGLDEDGVYASKITTAHETN
jgi:threonylcarbamoyladenosine tRNA methylthiotransferase MtaB